MKSIALISVLFFGLVSTSFAEDECLKWFQNSGVKPSDKGCILNCDLIPKDMSTFDCANRCEEFCKSKKCVPDPYWKNKIKNGAPASWSIPVEIPVDWTEMETNQILAVLNLLPDQVKSVSIEGIFRMKKSTDIVNPASTSKDGKEIVIYDRSFHSPFWSLSSVVTHEIGHAVFQQMSFSERQAYSKTLGWNKKFSSKESRPGDFVSSRSKADPNEDFAENFSFFLLSKDVLRARVPKAYDWFIKKFTANFKLKEACQNEKN